MSQTVNTILKGFFWFAFASFLAASIPHVAYFFRAFEPQVRGGQDPFYWGIAYAIAVSIDVMIFLLSVTVAQLRRQHVGMGTVLSVWAFILLLCGMSWFINWQYAEQFSSTMLSHVTGTHLDLLGFSPSVGQIDPAIASMFQVFAIAYTYIADKIATGKAKTAEELKVEADEEEQRSKEQDRLDALRHQRRERRVAALAGTIRQVAEQVGQARGKPDEAEILHRVVQLFRDMPQLQKEENAALADTILKDVLKLRSVEIARIWRMQAVHILAQELERTAADQDEQTDQSGLLSSEEIGHLTVDQLLNFLAGQPALRDRLVGLSVRDPQTAREEIAMLLKQHSGWNEVSPWLVSQIMHRLLTPTKDGHEKGAIPDRLRTGEGHETDPDTHVDRDVLTDSEQAGDGEVFDPPGDVLTHESQTEEDVLSDAERSRRWVVHGQATDTHEESEQTTKGPNPDGLADEHADVQQSRDVLASLAALRSKGQRYITVEEAAQATGYDAEYLKKLARLNKIRRSSRDKHTLLLSSLTAYVERQKVSTAR